MTGEAYTAFFNYLNHNGGFYYQVCPSPVLINMNRADPTEISCMNSGDVTRPSTQSGHRYSWARTGSACLGRSDTNITRLLIAPKVTCGSVAGVLATRREPSVCGRTAVACSHGLVDVSVFRLPRRVVLPTEVTADDQPRSRTVSQSRMPRR